MNVYLVLYGDSYEGYTVNQVFSNESAAFEYMGIAQQDSNRSGEWQVEAWPIQDKNTYRLLFVHEAHVDIETGKDTRNEGHNRLTTADTFRNSHKPNPGAWNHCFGIGASSVSYEDAVQLARDAITGKVVRDPG